MPIINTLRAWPEQPPSFEGANGYAAATTDPVWGGVMITIDALPDAAAVLVTRDGQPVFSGAPAPLTAGAAVVYDPFAPFDADVIYEITPMVYSLGELRGSGSPQETIAVHTAPMDLSRGDITITPQWDLGSMVWATTNGDQPEQAWDAIHTLAYPPGAELPGGSWDIPNRTSWTVELIAKTKADQNATIATLKQGPVYVRFSPDGEFEDGWCLPTGLTTAKTDAEDFLTTVAMQPIVSPSPDGSPLQIPGRTYGHVARGFATYQELKDSVATYKDLLALEVN